MPLIYHVEEHDGGYAYRVKDVWSEPFPDHDTALAAAKAAAQRQQLGGEDTEITFETADGQWRTELASGGDRPETQVIDESNEIDANPDIASPTDNR